MRIKCPQNGLASTHGDDESKFELKPSRLRAARIQSIFFPVIQANNQFRYELENGFTYFVMFRIGNVCHKLQTNNFRKIITKHRTYFLKEKTPKNSKLKMSNFPIDK